MKNLLFIKTLKGLGPYDQRTADYVAKIGLNDVVSAEMRKPRNPAFHRKFFALLDIVYSNLPEDLAEKFKSEEDLLLELKLQTGHREKYRTLGGREIWIPKSIAFSEMDNDEFADFYEKCLDVIYKHIIPGVDLDELENAVSSAS